MNTPPEDDVMSLSRGSDKTRARADLFLGKETALTASWERLLQQLRKEVRAVTQSGSSIVPTIEFADLRYTLHLPSQ